MAVTQDHLCHYGEGEECTSPHVLRPLASVVVPGDAESLGRRPGKDGAHGTSSLPALELPRGPRGDRWLSKT